MSDVTPAPETPQGPVLSETQQVTQQAAAAAAAVHTQARELATLLSPDPVISAMILKGVVTAINLTGTPPTLSAQLAGDTSSSVALIRFMDTYTPVVGDTCLIVKQGAEIFCLGQMNDTSTGAANGWVTPTLGSGFTHTTSDNIQYRIVVDRGDRLVQMRGSCTISGTPTALWTMPTGLRPVTYRSILLGRNVSGGSNTAVLGINTNGTMFLDGTTTGVMEYAPGDVRTGLQSSTPATSAVDVNHTHFSSDGPNPATPSSWTTTINTGFTLHHHDGGDHQHYLNKVIFPTSLSFHGCSYYL